MVTTARMAEEMLKKTSFVLLFVIFVNLQRVGTKLSRINDISRTKLVPFFLVK